MAAISPRSSNDGLLDFTLLLVKPIPPNVAQFVCDHDISKMGKVLSAPDDSRSFEEKMEFIYKNLDLFKWPHARRDPLDDVLLDLEDDEDDEDDEDEKMICDEEKPDGDVELQVPNEGEPKCKKPRLSESFVGEGSGEEIEAEETSNSH